MDGRVLALALQVRDEGHDDGEELLLGVARVVGQVVVPRRVITGRLVDHEACKAQSCGSRLRRRNGKEALVQEHSLLLYDLSVITASRSTPLPATITYLHKVLGQGPRLNVIVIRLGATPQKVERVGKLQVELEHGEHVPFGLDDLVVGVSSVGNVDDLVDGRHVDLLVLGGDQ